MFAYNKNLMKYIFVMVAIFLQNSCTDFGGSGDDIDSKTKSTLSGTIHLGSASDESGVYVYLEGFEKYTITDSEGNFELEIDPPRIQPGGGITGSYPLYFYIDNYDLKKIYVPVTQGEFAYGQGDINSKGKFRSVINLNKIIDITTSVSPDQISRDFDGNIDITVFLTNLVDTVLISTKSDKNKSFSGAFFRNSLHKENIHLMEVNGVFRSLFITEPQEWHMYLDWDSTGVSAGNYEIIPYIKVVHQGMPQKLKDILGFGSDSFTKDFLNIPNTYQTSSITITDPAN